MVLTLTQISCFAHNGLVKEDAWSRTSTPSTLRGPPDKHLLTSLLR